MQRGILLILMVTATSLLTMRAQSPTPIIIQAAVPASAQQPSVPTANPASVAQDSASLLAALKSLQEMKAANEETLKRQEAAIEQLDDLQKAAEQMKIFTKRG